MVEDRLVWIDLEMTGLDPDENTIIEIATIVTEGDLSIVAEGPSFAISVSEEDLAKLECFPPYSKWIDRKSAFIQYYYE